MKTNLPKNQPRIVPLLFLCLLLVPHFVSAQAAQTTQPTSRTIHIAAAADLQPILPAISDAFTHATGIDIIVHYGTSASLASQLLAGDPADIFLATDYVFPEQIIARGLADSPEPIPYARGVLVLWARNDSPLQPLTQNTLRDPRLQSLAIPDPDHISYGIASVAVLHSMKLYDQLNPHFVVAQDLAQTAQFVESGKAQLGFISQIAASTPHMKQLGSFILMPSTAYGDIRLCAVVLGKSLHRSDAHAFLDWLRSPPIQQALPNYGLSPIEQTPVHHP
jgi:molybdate transport system substrate-binding protein